MKSQNIVSGLVLIAAIFLVETIVLNGSLAATQELETPSEKSPQVVIWTAIIPDQFPGIIYTWNLKADGTYTEDGRDAATGKVIEKTQSGQWKLLGPKMILHQDGSP